MVMSGLRYWAYTSQDRWTHSISATREMLLFPRTLRIHDLIRRKDSAALRFAQLQRHLR